MGSVFCWFLEIYWLMNKLLNFYIFHFLPKQQWINQQIKLKKYSYDKYIEQIKVSVDEVFSCESSLFGLVQSNTDIYFKDHVPSEQIALDYAEIVAKRMEEYIKST